MHLLPPVVVGPVIMVIGLSLAPTAVNMAMFENSAEMKGYNKLLNCCFDYISSNHHRPRILQGFLSLIPVLIGIIVGYIVSIFMGIVKFAPIAQAKWIDFPHIYLPFKDYTSFHLGLILVMIRGVCDGK